MKNNLLSINEIVSAVNGSVVKNVESEKFVFTSVATDSRQVAEGSLFVPLVGENQDGHKYIPAALEKGAGMIFLNKTEYDARHEFYDALAARFPFVLFVAVENTLYALQNAATFYVQKFPRLIKIGVTGSSGKTTIKEIIAACLREKYNVIANEGNLNSETGVALSAFKIREEHEVGVFEMGMNRENEIAEIVRIIKPNFAIVTNIGTAHVGLLGSREAIAREKKNVFNFVNNDGAAFVPYGDDFENFLCRGVKGKVVKYGNFFSTSVNCSASGEALVNAGETENGVQFVADKGFGGTVFLLDGIEITLHLAGSYNYKNALGAVAVARYFGVGAKQIKHALESLDQIPGRAEIETVTLRNGADVLVFKDCYNANPDSMTKSIAFCANASTGGIGTPSSDCVKKIFVLGDMFELGSDSNAAHQKVGEEVAAASPDMTIFVGNEMKLAFNEAVRRGYENSSIFVQGSDDGAMKKIADLILNIASSGDAILLKGSRSMRLERVVDFIVDVENERGDL